MMYFQSPLKCITNGHKVFTWVWPMPCMVAQHIVHGCPIPRNISVVSFHQKKQKVFKISGNLTLGIGYCDLKSSEIAANMLPSALQCDVDIPLIDICTARNGRYQEPI